MRSRFGLYYCIMSSKDKIQIREEYTLANCCKPSTDEAIVGYHSYGELIKIHTKDCPNLANVESNRLVELDWHDVVVIEGFTPNRKYLSLGENDFRILALHLKVGLDYSHKVARMLHLEKQEVFDRHIKLREIGLLRRVPKVMIRYRKGVVDNKWIKHRNHTYYELTEEGRKFAEHYVGQRGRDL